MSRRSKKEDTIKTNFTDSELKMLNAQEFREVLSSIRETKTELGLIERWLEIKNSAFKEGEKPEFREDILNFFQQNIDFLLPHDAKQEDCNISIKFIGEYFSEFKELGYKGNTSYLSRLVAQSQYLKSNPANIGKFFYYLGIDETELDGFTSAIFQSYNSKEEIKKGFDKEKESEKPKTAFPKISNSQSSSINDNKALDRSASAASLTPLFNRPDPLLSKESAYSSKRNTPILSPISHKTAILSGEKPNPNLVDALIKGGTPSRRFLPPLTKNNGENKKTSNPDPKPSPTSPEALKDRTDKDPTIR